MPEQDLPNGRMFVVGCSRSGTTLLLSRLAGHPAVHAFPETGLLLRLFGMRGIPTALARLGLSLGREQKSLRKALGSISRLSQSELRDANIFIPKRQVYLQAALSASIHFFDQVARLQGCSWWVEKTPRHYYYAHLITEQVPNTRVIHIVRDGADVVRSIVDRARRHPELFPRQSDPYYATAQWNRALRAHIGCLGKAGHAFVIYEDLITNPERELSRLARECGLSWHPNIVAGALNGASFVASEEIWKRHAIGPILSDRNPKATVFDRPTTKAITSALNLKIYCSLVKGIRASSAV
ncbi:sulfotransferase family protein [Lamprobacter modestohalophilus]|nr:sulfotransferase [Lamprobacter modestohalophilus]